MLASIAAFVLGCPTPKQDDGTTSSETSTTTSTTAAEDDAETSSTSSVDTTSEASTTEVGEDSTTNPTPVDLGTPGDESCDPWAPDCPPGTKCMPYATPDSIPWNAARCSPIVEDPDTVGEPCTVDGGPTSGIDSCDATSMCWAIDQPTQTGTCIAFCTGTPDEPTCAAEGEHCNTFGGGFVNVCLPTCHPLQQNCGPGENCYPTERLFTCNFDAGGQYGQYGAGCDYVNVCDPGLYCAPAAHVPNCDAGTAGCCTPFCDVTDPDASASCPGAADGQICVPWFDEGEAPEGFEDVGSCLLP